MKSVLKILFVLVFVFFAFGFVVYKFYQEDFKNSLPTQVPKGYNKVEIGTPFRSSINSKITLIHFFNPNCPCSKFNKNHIKKIVDAYEGQVQFRAYSTDKGEIIDFPIPVEYDKNGEMAKLYGVYSTPQAVILDQNGVLIYRGNYNKSRYCSNKDSEFAVLAIEKALNKKSTSEIMFIAGKPYGCSIFK